MFETYLIYNFVLLFSVFFAWIGANCKQKLVTLFWFSVSFCVMWIPAAIRYGIGHDYFSYTDYYVDFLNKGPATYEHQFEYGFQFIYFVLTNLGLPSHSFFVVTSFLIYFFVYKAFLLFGKKYLPLMLLCYLCVAYFSSFSIIRQMMAFSLVLYGIAIIMHEGRTLKSFMVLVAACFFHISSIFVLLLWPFFQIRLKPVYLMLGIFIFGFLFIYMDLARIILSTFAEGTKYYHFLNNEQYSAARNLDFQRIGGFLIKILPALLLVIYATHINRVAKNSSGLILLGLVYIVLTIASMQFFIITRLAAVFSVVGILGVMYLMMIQLSYRKILIALFVFSNLVLFETTIYLNPSRYSIYPNDGIGLGITPYSSIFDKTVERHGYY